MGRPIETTLQEHCDAEGLAATLKKSWAHPTLTPSDVGAYTHEPYPWRCVDCGGAFSQDVRHWTRSGTGTCERCSRARGGLKRRLPLLCEMASEGDRAAVIAQQQYDDKSSSNPSLGTLPTRLSDEVDWRCPVCSYTWRQSPKNRRASISQCLKRLGAAADTYPNLACKRCADSGQVSQTELRLGAELEVLLVDVVISSGSPRKIDGLKFPYTPDFVIDSAKLFIEYDGWYAHSKKAAVRRDKARTQKIEKATGYSVIRIREEGKDGPLPAVCSHQVDVPNASPVNELAFAAATLAVQHGALLRPTAPALAVYRSLKPQNAVRARQLIADWLQGLWLLDLDYIREEYESLGSFKALAAKKGIKLSSLSTQFSRLHGVSPVDWAAGLGLAVHGGTAKRGAITPAFEGALGDLPDNAIAEVVGVSKQSVAEKRQRRGLNPCRRRRTPWQKDLCATLGLVYQQGTIGDVETARLLTDMFSKGATEGACRTAVLQALASNDS